MGVIQRALSKPTSDHTPVLLDGGGVSWGPSPFRFELSWLEEPNLIDLIESWWKEMQFDSNPGYIMWRKLKELKDKLKEWRSKHLGRLDNKGVDLLKEIEAIDVKEGGDGSHRVETEVKSPRN
ncbi:hypothetical protein BVC80_977g6 [Macleaya cordata]|uniref:Endonuclease/exonuclease/phosphatase n=1 Tax=Macleaya cordata TaxID=56857 RepID=A0A200QRP2_MACCD|nr:hypothetical protein BVC80_977g6 [Macleaya cordata]